MEIVCAHLCVCVCRWERDHTIHTIIMMCDCSSMTQNLFVCKCVVFFLSLRFFSLKLLLLFAVPCAVSNTELPEIGTPHWILMINCDKFVRCVFFFFSHCVSFYLVKLEWMNEETIALSKYTMTMKKEETKINSNEDD